VLVQLLGLVLQSPKSQDREVMLPVEASVKVTIRGAGPKVGLALKFAVGAVGVEAMVALTSFENALQVVLPLLYALAAK